MIGVLIFIGFLDDFLISSYFAQGFPKFFFESKSTTYSFQVLIYSLALDNASNRSEERNTSLWDYTGRQFLGSLGNGLLLYPLSLHGNPSFLH